MKDSILEKNYEKKIAEKINSIINGVDLNEGVQQLLELNQKDRFNQVSEWATSLKTSVCIMKSVLSILINEIEYSSNTRIDLFNQTWDAFSIICDLNVQDDIFKELDGLSTLSGYFKWFQDENTGWIVLYYIANKECYFCGLYKSEEDIDLITDTCYSLKIDLEQWNDSSYILNEIEKITGIFYDEDSHSSSINNFNEYYEILGIDQDASQDEIKKAYRKKCREYHPDVYKGDDANEIMSKINEAYNKLKVE